MRVFRPDSVPPVPLSDAWRTWLATKPRFDLEIGAGRGLHAIRYALAHPERTLVALERTEEKFAGLSRRHRDHGAPGNLRALRADAVSFVAHAVGEEQLTRVFLLYPNPYPKARQRNQRWHFAPFTARLKRAMAPGAELILATNLAWYADEARVNFPDLFGFRLVTDRRLTRDDPPRTHFEKKYLARGENCFDLVFARD